MRQVKPLRLAVLTSHPIQYYAPLFRELARRVDLHVFFAHKTTPQQQADTGFGTAFDWDVDLTSSYANSFLTNVSRRPGTGHFSGCDTPEIGERLRRGRFDAVLVMGWHLKTYWQAIWAAKHAGLPVLVRGDSHLETPRSNVKRIVKSLTYPPFLRMFDAALYVGQRSRAYYKHYGYPSERLFFSPNCVDTEWFATRATAEARAKLRNRLGIAAEAKVALFAGKLVAFKRPLDIVAAAASMKASGYAVSLLVAGSGPLEAELAATATASGVSLHRLGFCNQTEMPAAYAAADVVVLPSGGRETWGLVANEAQACGVPIVVSDACGCAPDLAGDGTAGRVFPFGDTEALSSALRVILDHPPPRKAIFSKSTQYSIVGAAHGIVEALAFAVRPAEKQDRR
jgi:glycosyltransferase involved in cell wall biosynthesis